MIRANLKALFCLCLVPSPKRKQKSSFENFFLGPKPKSPKMLSSAKITGAGGVRQLSISSARSSPVYVPPREEFGREVRAPFLPNINQVNV